MKRVALTDGDGWFDAGEAITFLEDTWWDGSNQVSRATGSQFEHQKLFYTRKGQWVLKHWSQWQGTQETYEQIYADTAARWLIAQDCLDSDEYGQLPEDVRGEVEQVVEEQEV